MGVESGHCDIREAIISHWSFCTGSQYSLRYHKILGIFDGNELSKAEILGFTSSPVSYNLDRCYIGSMFRSEERSEL